MGPGQANVDVDLMVVITSEGVHLIVVVGQITVDRTVLAVVQGVELVPDLLQ